MVGIRGEYRAARSRQFHDPEGRRLTAPRLGPAAIHHRARWRLFLSPRAARLALLRRGRRCALVDRLSCWIKLQGKIDQPLLAPVDDTEVAIRCNQPDLVADSLCQERGLGISSTMHSLLSSQLDPL